MLLPLSAVSLERLYDLLMIMAQVSLLDTDLDAEVSASVETEERIRREEEEAKARKRALELQAEAAEAVRKVRPWVQELLAGVDHHPRGMNLG